MRKLLKSFKKLFNFLKSFVVAQKFLNIDNVKYLKLKERKLKNTKLKEQNAGLPFVM